MRLTIVSSCITDGMTDHERLALAVVKEPRALFFSISAEFDFDPCHTKIFSKTRKSNLQYLSCRMHSIYSI